MDSLAEIKQNENLNINSESIAKEIETYFDNVSEEELINDLSDVGIEVEKVNKSQEKSNIPGINAYICNDEYEFDLQKGNSFQAEENNEMKLLAA
jgi:hypothetical protein